LSSKKTNSINSVTKVFGNKVRVRVCGLLFQENSLLLIKHNMGDYNLWAPPGGGVEFGESIEDTLIREFKEETGLAIQVKTFLFLHEHIAPPLHAVELFYHVVSTNFNIIPGNDPELGNQSILDQFKFIDAEKLEEIPAHERHAILRSCINPIELLDKTGQIY
jgi:8-oxo-dGTP diphosphatase